MNKIKAFTVLVKDTRQKVEEFGITSKTVFKNFDRCVKLLSNHIEINDLEFNLEVGLEWLVNYELNVSNTIEYTYNCYNAYRRTIYLLWENKNKQLVSWKTYPSIIAIFPKTNKFIKIISDYRDYLNKNFAEATVKFRLSCAKGLLVFFEESKIYTIEEVTNKLVADYFVSPHFENRKPAGVHAEAIRIKLFLEYLEDNGITKNKLLHYAVPKYRVQETKIITTITPLAEEKILGDYPNLPSNKREKAMCLLALNMGFRTCDIHNLKFSDINWEIGQLQIIQQKTGVTIKRKIDNTTQNAIIDYILNERRTTDCENIFITSVGPIKRLQENSKTIYRRIKGIDIKKNIPHQGLHILRRTFASKLLRIGTPLPIISSSLGHIDKRQVHCYLSTDDKKMKQCALSLTSISFGRCEF